MTSCCSSSSSSSSSDQSPRLLHRLLIDFDVSLANTLLRDDVLESIKRRRMKGTANGIPDVFTYNCVQALQADTGKWEYKLANLLLWGMMHEPFLNRLLENEPFRVKLEKKIQELYMRFIRGERPDGQHYDIQTKKDKHAAIEGALIRDRHLHSTGWLVRTIRNMYASCY
jgi:hypothetical protein